MFVEGEDRCCVTEFCCVGCKVGVCVGPGRGCCLVELVIRCGIRRSEVCAFAPGLCTRRVGLTVEDGGRCSSSRGVDALKDGVVCVVVVGSVVEAVSGHVLQSVLVLAAPGLRLSVAMVFRAPWRSPSACTGV